MLGKEPSPPADWEALKIVAKDKDTQGKGGESKDQPEKSIADDPAGQN